jgi:thioredoxin-dependent peroxiredoxin
MSRRPGDIARDFDQESNVGPAKFNEWLGGSWGVLFLHTADLTLCATKWGLTAKLADEFQKRDDNDRVVVRQRHVARRMDQGHRRDT